MESDAHRAFLELLQAVRLTADERRPPETSLTGAAARGDVETAREFLEGGADIEERSIGFASPLQAAASFGHLPMVEFLLSRGASPREKPDALVDSPLSAAANHGHAEVVRRLIDAIGDLSTETRAVPRAAASGQAELLELLLAREAPLEPHAGHTLRMAAYGGRYRCVKVLLEAGVDPREHPDYHRDLLGEPCDPPYLPRQAALDNGHATVALLLDGRPMSPGKAAAVEAKVQRQRQKVQAALGALAGGERRSRETPPLEGEARLAAVRQLVSLVPSLGATGHLEAALPEAAEAGHRDLVSALLAAGASPDAREPGGATALHLACTWGHEDVVARLLAAGASVDVRDGERRTPLMLAAERGSVPCVRRLMDAGADPSLRVRGRSARGLAAGPRKGAIRALLEGARP